MALPTVPRTEDGSLRNHPKVPGNIAFRFGVEQSGKLRGRDDIRDSLTNTARIARSPIALPGWGHIATDAKVLAPAERDWPFGKIDHRAAYKARHVRPEGPRYASIALRNPSFRARDGFRTKTQLFGSAAAGLRYN